MQNASKYLLSTVAVLAALVLIVASCAMNWVFWSGQGRTELEAHIFGAVSVSFDVIKSALPTLIVSGLAARQFGYSLVGSLAFVLFFAAALISAIGFISSNRGAVSGTLVTKTAALTLAAKEAAELELRVSGYPKTAPSTQLDAQLEKLRTNRRWQSSLQCTNATAAKSRRFCADYATAKAAFATAMAYERDSRKLSGVRAEIKRLRNAGAGSEANPQAAMIARFLPSADTTDAEFGITVFVAVLTEFGAAFGLFLALNHWPAAPRTQADNRNSNTGTQKVTVIDQPPTAPRKPRARRQTRVPNNEEPFAALLAAPIEEFTADDIAALEKAS